MQWKELKSMRIKLLQEWIDILNMRRISPYVFRTRLERVLNHTVTYANMEKNIKLKKMCNEILEKLKYISDQSNQTSDGILNSFVVLENDMKNIKCLLQ